MGTVVGAVARRRGALYGLCSIKLYSKISLHVYVSSFAGKTRLKGQSRYLLQAVT